ncbi:uncharacterized protein LOC135830688 [Sycon ciliatum]|uniref:uncharacterized protein LOC135830688 n=1 Tax=Sycon ciliatum TaxID=27933 RepID=UPI0031F6A6F7
MRRKDGGYYQEPGYHGFRAAIQRQLTSHGRQFNVHTDVEFQKLNDVLDGVLKKNKREGHSNPVQHKDPIKDIDIDKISYFFDRSKTAENLTRHVWFFITLHLGLRGREVQRKITKTDVEFGTDGHGEFARLSADFATKNYQGGRGSARRDAGAGKITDRGQLLSLRVMMTHLHPDCPALFQRAKQNYATKDKVWFCNSPLGKTTLGNMMPEISKAAQLTQIYTNHYLRATVVSMLSGEGIEQHQIMALTGHRNSNSLTSYTRPTTAQKRTMSDILDGKKRPEAAHSSTAKAEIAQPESVRLTDVFRGFTDMEIDLLFRVWDNTSTPSVTPAPKTATGCSSSACNQQH